jgi:tetratricopeptide (TPR) repeat protein
VLVVIEGAEVADGQTPRADLPTLLSVLSPENRTLVLTRSSAQVLPAQTVSLAQALAPQDAADLLDDLTRDTLAPDLRQRVLTLLQGHPLALHWAGNLLARDDDDPALLIGDWERGALPLLSDPVNAGHTLRWLFDRSARSLDAPARQALGLCARLGAAPVPLALVEAGMGDGAREALKRLVQQGLMRREASLSAHWVFCHVLAHGYAREAIAAPPPPAPRRLADWLHGALPAAVGSSERPCTVDEAQVGRLLAHAQAVLLADPQGELVWTVANALLYDVSDRLKELGHSTLTHRALTCVDAWHAQLLPAVAQRTSMQRERGAILSRLGNVLGLQGDLAGALQAYRDGLAISERLARADATNAGWQRDLSVSRYKVGDVLQAQGDLAGALQAYRDGLAIRERLARADATNAGWQRDLSVSHEKVGEVLQAQGDLAGALQAYRDGLAIRERLARSDATNAGWQRDLFVSWIKLALVSAQQGDGQAALDYAQAGLRITERLTMLDPSNATWRNDLSVCRRLVARLSGLNPAA